jgi:hypothetical protein
VRSGGSDDGDRGRAWSRRCKVVKVEVRISELSKAARKLRREGSRGGGATEISDKTGRWAGTERQVIGGGRETENVSKLGATGHAFSTYCAGAAGLFFTELVTKPTAAIIGNGPRLLLRCPPLDAAEETNTLLSEDCCSRYPWL